MENKTRLSTNIFFTLVQSISIALIYFFLYRFLLKHLGVEQLGVWSIVLAISSTANITNLGIGASVIRFTAKLNFANDHQSINKLIHTSFFLIGGLFLMTGILIYFIALHWLHYVIEKDYLALSIQILPYSILCLWLNAISNSVFLPCMDGLQSNFRRSILTTFTTALLLLASIWLVPKHGLMGVAYAQIIQAGVLLLLSVFVLKNLYTRLVFFPFIFDKTTLKQIFSFGIKEQVISFAQLCFDPLTKSLLANFGGLSFVAYYEIANRFVTQARALLVSSNQVMMPLFTEASERLDSSLDELYKKNFTFIYLLSIMWVSAVIYFSFILSALLFGKINSIFIFCSAVLSFASFFNILCSPAYFSNMGCGNLNNNVIGNIIIAVLNVVFGFLLGQLLAGYGAVLGWGLALTLGSVFIIHTYHKAKHINMKMFLTWHSNINAVLMLVFTIGISFLFFRYSFLVWQMIAIGLPLLFIFSVFPFFNAPQVKTISATLRKQFGLHD